MKCPNTSIIVGIRRHTPNKSNSKYFTKTHRRNENSKDKIKKKSVGDETHPKHPKSQDQGQRRKETEEERNLALEEVRIR